jgi:hypothetical protein
MDLVPCLGLCCCFLSFYTEIPDCFGTVCESSVCCVNNRTLLCKTGKEEDVYCRCLALECDVLGCKTCIKVSTAVVYPLSYYAFAHTFFLLQSRSQICCLDLRISLPPSEQVPCLITLACMTVST